MTLESDYTVDQVAEALGMSPRWVRQQVNQHGAAHQRYGHKLRFTAEQVEALRASHAKAPISESITTGRKRGAK